MQKCPARLLECFLFHSFDFDCDVSKQHATANRHISSVSDRVEPLSAWMQREIQSTTLPEPRRALTFQKLHLMPEGDSAAMKLRQSLVSLRRVANIFGHLIIYVPTLVHKPRGLSSLPAQCLTRSYLILRRLLDALLEQNLRVL